MDEWLKCSPYATPTGSGANLTKMIQIQMKPFVTRQVELMKENLSSSNRTVRLQFYRLSCANMTFAGVTFNIATVFVHFSACMNHTNEL